MSFQIGIGDVVLLVQMSLRLTRALSTGRKSAPAELQGVEQQLSLLTTALEAAKNVHSSLRDDIEQQNLAACLESVVERCRATLTDLEGAIAKYRIINESAISPRSTLGRFNDSLARNWRKVEWTTEKGNLQELRDELMQHTNTINLVVGMSTNVQARQINVSLSQVHTRTKDLHVWYEKNLAKGSVKSPRNAQNTTAENRETLPTIAPKTAPSTFELLVDRVDQKDILCANAAISDAWLAAFSAVPEELPGVPLFSCWCKNKDGPLASDDNRTMSSLIVSPSTFPVRQAGREQVWRILRMADRHANVFVTLQIGKIHAEYVATLQSMVMHPLIMHQAEAILDSGQGNSLAYNDSSDEARVLASVCNLHESSVSVMSVKVAANNRSILYDAIANIQLTRYQGLASSSNAEPSLRNDVFVLEPTAEILIEHHGDDDLPIEKRPIQTTLTINRSTKHELDEKDAAVSIYSVYLESEYADGRETFVFNASTTIYFATVEAAKEFYAAFADMRFELFIHSLQHPRIEEAVFSMRRALQIECHGDTTATYIDEGLISAFSPVDPVDNDFHNAFTQPPRYRLAIVSISGNMVISQDLPAGFLNQRLLEADGLCSLPQHDGPRQVAEAFVAQVNSEGIWRLKRYEKGFKSVTFISDQGVRETIELDNRSFATAHGSLPGLGERQVSRKLITGASEPHEGQ